MKSASAFGASALAIFASAAQAADKSTFSIDSTDSIKSTAGTIVHDLLQYYKGNETGQIPGLLPGRSIAADDNEYWWYESAIMWGILIDYAHYTGDAKYNDLIMQGLQFQTGENNSYMPRNQTLSMGNDDQALWGLAALLAAERDFPNPPADKPQWLALAENVFNSMIPERWDDKTCGGGMRWMISPTSNGYNYKSTMANGGLFNLASRLAHFTGNQTYADWADKTWEWMETVKLVDNETYAVYDGAMAPEDCKDVNKIQYSLSNAFLTQGAAYMYNHTNADSKWKGRVDGLVKSGLKLFFKNGAAFEPACEGAKTCSSDTIDYKGLLHQWYATTSQLASFTSDMIRPVLKTSAQAAVAQCTGGKDARQCGSSWSTGKYDGKTGARQEMSVLAAVSSLLVGDSAAPGTVNDTTSAQPGSGSGPGKSGSSGDGTKGNGTGSKDGSDSAAFKAGANVLTVAMVSAVVAVLSSISL